jgi:DNA-binding LytR/AlgR family response regulator
MVLDIQMPQQSGLDFLTTLANPPVTIIITAYPEYALQGYELDVIDYIVKPVPFERFYKAVSKADEFLKLKKRQTKENPDYFFVKADGKIEKILFDDVLFIEAHENYSSIHTKTGKFMVLVSLKNLEASLNKEKFMRVHKSFIVSISRINSIEGNTVLIDTHKVTVSRDIRQTLIAAWTKNELVRR